MAILLHQKSERQTVIGSPCLVGRSSACTLRIQDRRVSGEHARLVWTGVKWEVRDLGSRNGTWVGGRKLASGNPESLRVGASLAFGTEADVWTMVDDSPPTLMARLELGDELRVAEQGMLALPSSEQPSAVLVEESLGVWMLEQGDRYEPVSDLQRVEVEGQAWRISLPSIHEATLGVSVVETPEELGLRFVVSRDQEHVELMVRHPGGEQTMTSRVHHFLLLALARRRLEDRARPELPSEEHGWMYVEDLVEALQSDAERLNVDVYRIRRQFSEAGVVGATRVIERRRLTRQLRVATQALEIIQL